VDGGDTSRAFRGRAVAVTAHFAVFIAILAATSVEAQSRSSPIVDALLVPPRHANFLRIAVTSATPGAARAIWRPYAGAVGSGNEQQNALQRRRPFWTNADSLRRWQDTTVRDTIRIETPAELIVDMTGGPITVEAVGVDSIQVRAQLTPSRGPVASIWGRSIVVSSDGVEPKTVRRR
jgi:hypothetical protein